MNPRTVAGFLALVPLSVLAAGCNVQKPITFKLSQETTTQNPPLSDLNFPTPQLSATPSRWEYKVVKAQQDGEQELSKFLNELGREGWEFVGQLQTKDSYLVLRRPKLARDYTRSRGNLATPDLPSKLSTGRASSNAIPGPPLRYPQDSSDRSSPKKDTRPTGLPRLGEKPGD